MEEITIGYSILKPVETQEQCDAYTKMAQAVNEHNFACKAGDVTWSIEDKPDCYEVVESGPSEKETAEQLKQLKEYKVLESKTELKEYLASHPLQWTDGEYYSVTEEKQSLLTSNLTAYKISVSMGSPIDLTWNTTGDKCKSWTFENLATLSLAIVKYVKPFVSKQQDLEIQIKNCSSIEEVRAIEIKYE